MLKILQRSSLVVLTTGGLACVAVSFAWLGCASSASNSPPSAPPSYWSGSDRDAAPRNARFKDNIVFLKAANVPVSEVYENLGPSDWESKELRLLAYRAENKQVLFVSYGTNNVVARHAVKKIPATDSLAEAATIWLRSN